MNLLEGKKVATSLDETMTKRVQVLKEKGVTPGLAVILVGDNSASAVYVRNKKRRAEKLGIDFQLIHFDTTVTEKELLSKINELNNDPAIDGFIVQLPVPDHIDEDKVIEAISPAKDVDGFTPISVGNLWIGTPLTKPATASGILMMLDYYNVDLDGKNVVIVGRSNIVGKPTAALMLNRNATVTITHSHTKNLKEITSKADVLVVAIGQAKFIKKDYVKDQAIVIDVGMDRDENGKLCGDVDFDDVKDHVSMITPVPGGVGPMTITALVDQVIELAEGRANG
ncbi:bifunctional 5,10-methylenetetrahydrofolate dehydrogenase/5,10-methenyltetrahydrofolate cyclohydrolase [Companilactobacillus paralimentarius]|uniref:bifunctional 5,10-methylenetetrahydrofolate dehydrogenase/5,10-methenyltetrahydrofolate cyclohydrolase n=1 Tax=Companilactobacillus paralimentarius TaxID=83526 RepID=UPI00046862E3|nr:tetrahydrofolate dehydrogenase/cyclohydrolase catalytic domain-containing protein [Companilactobacillus paralimentarius]KAE9561962.1 bifunctional 5,10-methylene-tetrahydrofolate dehydrogenase/5,10-methylene-tetrahydrofolate cyclohydrolase [Companilactobacillus paralimentarius]QFR68565.1 bifunctional 5,10-methylene-tetrahydrofolate dehydrogenase/5,10-methylene-tetrahydrofolate cyclohydrolase [Companilactobacillus paralimentarius]